MTLDRGGEPLKWMMEEADEQGLSVRLHEVKLDIPHVDVTNSMQANSMRGLLYNFLEILPFLRWREHLSGSESRSKWWPHFGSAREVLPHQSIHWTVNAIRNKDSSKNLAYTPKAIILDDNLEEEDRKKGVIKKEIAWGEFELGENRFGLPDWIDNHQSARLMNILEMRRKPANDKWFDELNGYALGEDPGKPDEIWAYGGPQFLQELLETYRDRKDTVKIIRSIIGFDLELQPSGPMGAPKSTVGYYEKKREQELARRLQDVVIPRAILLLEGWTAQEEHPKWPAQSFWARVRSWFGLSLKDTDESYDALNARWNWDRLPKETRSMDLARLVTDILSDAAKTRFGHVIQDASEKLAKQIIMVIYELLGGRRSSFDPEMPIESAASWEKKKAALAEGALNVAIALLNLGNDYCGMDVADSEIISDLVGMMYDYMAEDDPVKQQLANEASITLVTLTKHLKISDELEVMEKLLHAMEAGKHVDNILRVFRNVSTDVPLYFSLEHIKPISNLMGENADASFILANLASQYDFDIASWDVFNKNEIATRAVSLLDRQDMQVQAAAQLLRSLIDQESNLTKASDEPLNTSIVLPEVFLALTASLREPSRSQLAIDELLATIVRFLLLKPSPGNEIAVSDLEAEISGLTTLALAGNPRAILAVSAAFAHNGDNKERASQYMPSLAQMIALENQKFLKDSMEVVTVLLHAGYSLRSFHAKSVMDAVVAIIRAIYVGQLFAASAPESDWEKEQVIYAAFGLLEALCVDPENRNYLANAGILETVILESSSIYATDETIEQAKAVCRIPKQLAIMHEAQNDDENPAKAEDDQGEVGEAKDNPKNSSEDEGGAQETSSLIPKD
ncbi:hypothetical protein FRC09_016723 [Ceratobasidium sp. 395]|nr:hypothetical protein FRC09_016723 [Ceratobasidium sp. 395]